MRRSVLLAAVVGAVIAAPVAVYATHSFKDVPASNTFHADIEWLKDAGVTKGCNPPANDEFCPDDPVTREQMSAFMRRLAENRVVDAGSLDGQDGAAYGNPVVNTFGSQISLPVSTPVKVTELSIDTPGNGGLIVDSSAIVSSTSVSQPGTLIFWLQVDSPTCTLDGSQVETVMFGFERLADNLPTTGSAVGAVDVAAGSHVVTLCVYTDLDSTAILASLVAEYSTSVKRTVLITSGGLDFEDFLSDD